jgi:hypothetical protein
LTPPAVKLSDEALDAAQFLQQNIVQAQLNKAGRYGAWPRGRGADERAQRCYCVRGSVQRGA